VKRMRLVLPLIFGALLAMAWQAGSMVFDIVETVYGPGATAVLSLASLLASMMFAIGAVALILLEERGEPVTSSDEKRL